MESFMIDDRIEIICDWKKTRTAFKHVATLLIDGVERDSTKICYLNRTWEAYEFQDVLHKLIDETNVLDDKEKQKAKDKLDGKDGHSGEGNKRAMAGLKTVAMAMTMGDIIAKNQKEKNDWKTRMLKAGLEHSGLIMPDDWNELSEDEKERRLSLITDHLLK